LRNENRLSSFAILLVFFTNAQQTATTEDGRKVMLYDSGKWEYVKETGDTSAVKIDLNNFTKPATAKTFVKSEKNNFGVWYDNKKWKKNDASNNEDSEFGFTLAKGDGYAMAITERIEIDMDNLKDIALGNARKVAPDIELEKEEYRMVNGKKVKCIQMTGTATGIKFTFFGYYCSNDTGTIQFVCFTGKSLIKTYQKDFEELLNGLVTIEEGKKE